MAISKLIFNGVVQMDVTGDTVTANTLLDGETATGADGEGIVGVYNPPAFTKQTKSVTYTPTGSQQTDSLTPDVGYDGLERVNITINAMPSGTAGTPTATKGAVSDHAITVTPSVTNVAGYISGGTITGTGVSVAASELVSGSQNITVNDTYDVTNLAEVVVNVAGGGGDSWSWMGKNPTLVKDYGTTKVWLKDSDFNTWTPSTTAAVITASSALSSYTVDLTSYDYYVYMQFVAEFFYNSGATGTSQPLKYMADGAYSCYSTASNYTNFNAGAGNVALTAGGSVYRGLHYLNTSGADAYAYNTSYSIYPSTFSAPSASLTTITPNAPAISARCSNSYFTTANAAQVNKDTSYYEYAVQIWRVDRGTSDNGFGYAHVRDMWLNGIS